MLQNLQNEIARITESDRKTKAQDLNAESESIKNMQQRLMIEIEKNRTDLTLQQQKMKVMEIKNDEF